MPLNTIAWHGRTLADHTKLTDDNAAKGFRFLSLCVYGDRDNPTYAAVMILRQQIIAQKSWANLNATQWQQTFNEMSGQGWGPFIVSATGPADNPVFAVAFQQITPTPTTCPGLTLQQFLETNADQVKKGAVLHWADSYGSSSDPRYIAVWFPNTENQALNMDAVDEDTATLQKRFDALTRGAWARPLHLFPTPSKKYTELFGDTTIGAWTSRAGMTPGDYQAQFDQNMNNGLSPVRVMAEGTGGDARFAALFAERENVDGRIFRSTGSPEVSAIDNAVAAVMKANQVRGASLAIVKGTKLVYAKGYSWAEDGYPSVQPTTLFRQASVSKLFAALATYQLIERGKCSLATTLQSILQLKQPNGNAPADANFEKITIQHLLEMTAGIDPGLVWRDVPAVQASGAKLPVNPDQLLRYCATQMLVSTPRDKTKATYSNGGFFVLSQVVKTLNGAGSFESALTASLLQPLHITRVKQSRTLIESQDPAEARYHSRPLAVSQSVMTQDQPLVALGYGETNMENCDGCGGLSAAATDVARVLAALSLDGDSAILKKATLNQMLANAAQATQTIPAFGFYGFDAVSVIDAAKHQYAGYKGGSLSTSQNGIVFQTGGISYALCWNTATPTGPQWYPVYTDIVLAAESYDWGSTDLFPQYGMPSFAQPASAAPPMGTHTKFPRNSQIDLEQVSLRHPVSELMTHSA